MGANGRRRVRELFSWRAVAEQVAEVYEETRDRLVAVALDALELPDGPLHRQLVTAWFAFTEDLVGQWAREPTMPRPELLALLRDVLDRLVTPR